MVVTVISLKCETSQKQPGIGAHGTKVFGMTSTIIEVVVILTSRFMRVSGCIESNHLLLYCVSAVKI